MSAFAGAAIFIIAATIAAVKTKIVLHYALRNDLVDWPNERSSHSVPTPRGGGLAIVTTFLLLLVLALFAGAVDVVTGGALLVGGLLVAGIGFIDDHGHVPAGIRLAVHLIGAGLVAFTLPAGIPLQLGSFVWDGGFILLAIVTVASVWMINLFNFMDGIDGIAASQAVFVSLASCLLLADPSGSDRLLPSALLAGYITVAAASVGFLVWNWPPARIFMGDAGSGFLGFVLGSLAIVAASQGQISLWTSVILNSVFFVDATYTLIRRAVAGKRWYSAHRSHAYQQAAMRYESHRAVTAMTAGINVLWLLPVAWLAAQYPQFGFYLTLLAWVPLLLLCVWFKAGTGASSGGQS